MVCRVKTRLNAEPGISFTEFSYQLLQACDWAVLHREHGCKVQLGGSDQWGNIVAGIDLIKRQGGGVEPIDTIDTIDSGHSGKKKEKEIAEVVEESDEVYGLTTPLLTTENGDKFGKSAGNAVWLDESRTSVSDFYQVRLSPITSGQCVLIGGTGE